MKKILTLNLNKATAEAITEQLSISVCSIDMAQPHQTLNQLLETSCQENVCCFSQEMIFMAECSEDEMNQISRICHELGAHPIQVVVTEQNRFWTMEKLIADVCEEHELFMQFSQLAALMKKLNEMPDLILEKTDKLKLMEAYLCFQNPNVKKSDVEKAISDVSQILNKSINS